LATFCCKQDGSHFNIVNSLGTTNECNGRTDILIANATLHYAAWPKMYWWQWCYQEHCRSTGHIVRVITALRMLTLRWQYAEHSQLSRCRSSTQNVFSCWWKMVSESTVHRSKLL